MAIIFTGGFISGGVSSGNIKGALKGGIFAAITYGVAHGGKEGIGWIKEGFGRSLTHASLAGVSAVIDDGNFGIGFTASFLSTYADKFALSDIDNFAGRIIANSLVAGTISEVTGGKFANGALSAAFRVAFNELALDFESTGRNANKAIKNINAFMKNNSGKPIPVSKEDFRAILALSASDIDSYVGSGLTDGDFGDGIQTHKADTIFFNDKPIDYQNSRFLIEGQFNNGGKGVLGSTVNYIGIGLFTASANKPSASMGPLVAAWNIRQAAQGQGFWHNVNQISTGTRWAQIGYNFYQNSPKRKE